MKKQFFDYMHEIMDSNPDVYFITAGLGWPRIDELLEKYPDRCFNFEASEQTMLDAAVGLAYAGKIPIIYSITPFLLFRPLETWRTYISREKLNVIGIGAGRNDDYSKHDGWSHEAGDDWMLFNSESNAGLLQNVHTFWPKDEKELKKNMDISINKQLPAYINIPR